MKVANVAIKELVYSFLVDNNSEYKKAKGLNKNVSEKITHSEYKVVLLNKKCLRYSMNRIEKFRTAFLSNYTIFYLIFALARTAFLGSYKILFSL